MGWGSSSAAVQAATLTCSALAADTGCCQAGGQGQALPCKGIRSARQAVVQGDQEEPREDRVVLSTIHRAKGLEWDAVFVVRCMQGHLPMPFWPPDWRWPLPHPPIDSPFLPAQHSVGRHTFGLQPAPWRRAQVECVGVAHGTRQCTLCMHSPLDVQVWCLPAESSRGAASGCGLAAGP